MNLYKNMYLTGKKNWPFSLRTLDVEKDARIVNIIFHIFCLFNNFSTYKINLKKNIWLDKKGCPFIRYGTQF